MPSSATTWRSFSNPPGAAARPGVGLFHARSTRSSRPACRSRAATSICQQRGRTHTPIDGFLARIAAVDEVHTNRLHVGIAGAMLGRKVTFYDNDYFKNRAIFRTSIEPYYPNVRFGAPSDVPAGPAPWYRRLFAGQPR